MEGGWNPSHLRQGAFAYSLHQSLPGLYQQKLSGALGVGRCLDPTGEIGLEIEIGGLVKKNKTIGDVAGSRIKVSPKNWNSPCFVFPFSVFFKKLGKLMIEPPSCRDPVRQVTTVSSRSSSWWKLNGRRAEEFLHTEVWVWVIHPWGHPQIIHFCLGFSIINHPLIGVPPILGNHYIIDLSNFFPDDLWNSMRVSFPELLSAQKIISSKAPVFARKETVFSCNFTLTWTQWRPKTTCKGRLHMWTSPIPFFGCSLWRLAGVWLLRMDPGESCAVSHLLPKHWMALAGFIKHSNPYYCWWWTNHQLWIPIPIVHG